MIILMIDANHLDPHPCLYCLCRCRPYTRGWLCLPMLRLGNSSTNPCCPYLRITISIISSVSPSSSHLSTVLAEVLSGWTRPPVISTVSPSSILHARLHKCIICLSNVIMMPIIPSCLLQIKSFHNGSIVSQQIVGSLDNLRGSLSPVSAEDYDITIGGVLPSRGQSSVFQKGVGLQPNLHPGHVADKTENSGAHHCYPSSL